MLYEVITISPPISPCSSHPLPPSLPCGSSLLCSDDQLSEKIYTLRCFSFSAFTLFIEKMHVRENPQFIKSLYSIFLELPTPLQFNKDRFEESIKDPNVILNTLRINDCNGEIVITSYSIHYTKLYESLVVMQ